MNSSETNKINLTDYLKHLDNIQWILNDSFKGDWITLSKICKDSRPKEEFSIYSALIPSEQVPRCISEHAWDLHRGNGMPGSITYTQDGEWVSKYSLTGNDTDIKPIVFFRTNNNTDSYYPEILQEFVHFHNLDNQKDRNAYVSFDEDGEERTVIKIDKTNVQFRIRELKEFLKVTQYSLAIYFDVFRYAKGVLSRYNLSTESSFKIEESNSNLNITFQNPFDSDFLYCNSLLLGKRIITPEDILCDYAEDPTYEDFLIGVDDEGNDVKFNCNPNKLADNFGKNKGSPNYLTPVYFNKDVLQKYYNNPSKFEIHDSSIYAKVGWILSFDDCLPDKVMVYLGDIGMQLSPREQIYWRSYNIIPEGQRISETKYRRDFLGEFADTERSDHILKDELKTLNVKWEKRFGWKLFLELNDKDTHHLQTLRLMLTEEDAEFDSQIVSLAKITNDSINVKEIVRNNPEIQTIDGSIYKLKEFLQISSISSSVEVLKPLFDLQKIRSSGAAHRKGDKFKKTWTKLGYDGINLSKVLDDIFKNIILMLRGLSQELQAENY